MGKPFRIESTPATPPRDAAGRFTQLTPPAPPQIVDEARRSGRSGDTGVADERVPDHPVAKTTKEASGGYQEQNPWPPAGPVNDGNKKPMRVG
jgi:hypothetical protein